MKNNHILYPLILLFVTLAGCQRADLRPLDPTTDPQERTISFSAEAPLLSTRAIMAPKEGSRDLEVLFTKDDQVLIFVSQADTTFVLKTMPTSIGADGKKCNFEITLPDKVDLSKPMTLIGYTGMRDGDDRVTNEPEHFIIDKDRVLFNITPSRQLSLDEMRPPLFFRLDEFSSTDRKVGTISVTFSHIGTYQVIHTTNNSGMDRPKGKTDVCLTDATNGFAPQLPWAYNMEYLQSNVSTPFLDLSSGEVVYEVGLKRDYFYSRPMKQGQTIDFVNWFVPRPEARYGKAAIYYNDVLSRGEFVSEAYVSSGAEQIKVGHAYHTYCNLLPRGVQLTDQTGEPIKSEVPRITFTTKIPKGETIQIYSYFGYADLADAFVDLNDNGVKDEGEEIDKSYDFYPKVVDSPTITIYGKAETVKLRDSQITSIRLYNQDLLTSLSVSGNLLSKEALDLMMSDLPDIHHVEISQVAPKTLSLTDNPGTETCDLSIAFQKDWSVDIPVLHKDAPFVNLWMGGASGNLYLNVDAAPADRKDVWVDLNGNGIKEKGEEVTSFGLDADQMMVLPRRGKNVVIYGKITALSAPESGILALVESNLTSLKYVDISANGAAALHLSGMKDLEYLDVSDNNFRTDVLPFILSEYPNLKVLNMSESGISEVKGGFAHNPNLVYLNARGCGIEAMDLTACTKLRTLIVSDNNLSELDIKPLTGLSYLELIGNRMSKEALASVISSLPKVDAKIPGKLFLGRNPGATVVDIVPAQDKNWKVDIERDKGDNHIDRPKLDGEKW